MIDDKLNQILDKWYLFFSNDEIEQNRKQIRRTAAISMTRQYLIQVSDITFSKACGALDTILSKFFQNIITTISIVNREN